MSETPAYIRRILDISTAHVTAETARMLEDGEAGPTTLQHPRGFGFLVYVPSDPDEPLDENIPDDLKTVMLHAREYNCDWIMFDRDGMVINDLPEFDW